MSKPATHNITNPAMYQSEGVESTREGSTAIAAASGEADLPANLKSADTHASAHAPAPSATVEPVKETPLRKGERFQEIRLPAKYTPKAPEGTGTDDYRCFLVDPGFDTDQLVSGVQVLLDNAPLVHHVVVSKVEPTDVTKAE